MSLIRYSPRFTAWNSPRRAASLAEDFDRLFDFAFPGTALRSQGWTPALDLYENADGFTVTVELPGLKKEDVNLSVHENVLTVAGERKHQFEGKEGQTFRSERAYGAFQRSVTLPAQVDATKVAASYKDGVLTVTLPKAEEAKPRQITVNAD